MKIKIFSIFLCFCFLVSIPLSVSAAEEYTPVWSDLSANTQVRVYVNGFEDDEYIEQTLLFAPKNALGLSYLANYSDIANWSQGIYRLGWNYQCPSIVVQAGQSIQLPMTFYIGTDYSIGDYIYLRFYMTVRSGSSPFTWDYTKLFRANQAPDMPTGTYSFTVDWKNDTGNTVYINALGIVWERMQSVTHVFRNFNCLIRSASYRYLSPEEENQREIMYGWNAQPTPPAQTGLVDGYNSAEEALLSSQSDSLADAADSFSGALDSIEEYTSAFMSVKNMFDYISGEIPFFTALLAISLSLGLVSVLVNLGERISRHSKKGGG